MFLHWFWSPVILPQKSCLWEIRNFSSFSRFLLCLQKYLMRIAQRNAKPQKWENLVRICLLLKWACVQHDRQREPLSLGFESLYILGLELYAIGCYFFNGDPPILQSYLLLDNYNYYYKLFLGTRFCFMPK